MWSYCGPLLITPQTLLATMLVHELSQQFQIMHVVISIFIIKISSDAKQHGRSTWRFIFSLEVVTKAFPKLCFQIYMVHIV